MVDFHINIQAGLEFFKTFFMLNSFKHEIHHAHNWASFYDYLYAFQAIERELIKVSPGGLKYVGEYKAGRVEAKMDHLGCFCGKTVYAQ